jgi:hypothetical protein
VTPDLPVLYISGYESPAHLRGDRKHGPLLKKPFRVADLVEAVRAALAR